MSIGKLERLLDLIAELLGAARPITAAQIHERLPGYPPDKDSFKRAFERDKKDLREMGIPLRIEPVPGTMPPEEGYRIDPREYFLPDPGLDPDELAALHLAASAIRLDGSRAAEGLRKLGGGAGSGGGPVVATLPDAPHLEEVYMAVTDRCTVEFRYGDRSRTVDPWRLYHRRGRWYLQAYDRDAGGSRSFRLDRVQGDLVARDPGSARPAPAEGVAPVELDAWSLGEGEETMARLWVAAGQARQAARRLGPAASATWAEDGSVVLEFPVRNPEGFRSFVLDFLDDAEVLGPPELRAGMVEWLRAIAGGGA